MSRGVDISPSISGGVPASVSSSAQFNVNILNFGAESGKDSTVAIKAAQEEAEKLPGNWGVFFPAGTWLYKETIRQTVPWIGVPRKSILKQATPFTYVSGTWALQNKNFQTTFNAATAPNVSINDLDFVFLNTTVEEKNGWGFANVASGEVNNCHLSTEGAGKVTSLDVFACVRNMVFTLVKGVNTTGAAHGGHWIRNVCSPESEAEARENATENIVLNDCIFSTTTADEALAIFSAGGMVRHIHVNRGTIEAGASAVAHNHIASTILSTNSGERLYTAVEDVEWNSVNFIDTTGKLVAGHQLLVFGLEEDAGLAKTRLQNIKHVNCVFTVATTEGAVVSLNINNNHEGGTSGNAAINPTINAGTSSGTIIAVKGFPIVSNITTRGNVTKASEGCGQVQSGTQIEGFTKAEIEAKASVGLPSGTFYGYELINATTGALEDFGRGKV